MANSTNRRAGEALTEQKAIYAQVQRWHHGRSYDLFGWMDQLVIGTDGWGPLGIQACGAGEVDAHWRKMQEPKVARAIVAWLKQPRASAEIWEFIKIKAYNADGSLGKKTRKAYRKHQIKLDPILGNLELVRDDRRVTEIRQELAGHGS